MPGQSEFPTWKIYDRDSACGHVQQDAASKPTNAIQSVQCMHVGMSYKKVRLMGNRTPGNVSDGLQGFVCGCNFPQQCCVCACMCHVGGVFCV